MLTTEEPFSKEFTCERSKEMILAFACSLFLSVLSCWVKSVILLWKFSTCTDVDVLSASVNSDARLLFVLKMPLFSSVTFLANSSRFCLFLSNSLFKNIAPSLELVRSSDKVPMDRRSCSFSPCKVVFCCIADW